MVVATGPLSHHVTKPFSVFFALHFAPWDEVQEKLFDTSRHCFFLTARKPIPVTCGAGKGGCCPHTHLYLPTSSSFSLCNSSRRPRTPLAALVQLKQPVRGARVGWVVQCAAARKHSVDTRLALGHALLMGSIQMQITNVQVDASLQLNGSWVSLLPHAAGSPYCVIPGRLFS